MRIIIEIDGTTSTVRTERKEKPAESLRLRDAAAGGAPGRGSPRRDERWPGPARGRRRGGASSRRRRRRRGRAGGRGRRAVPPAGLNGGARARGERRRARQFLSRQLAYSMKPG